MRQITDFQGFCTALLESGFSLGGGADGGIFSVIPWSWNEAPPYPTPVRWHCGDPALDPREWPLRVLEERDDIAYGKFFFRKSGYITREFFPCFLACRRGGDSLADAYSDGRISAAARRVYDVISSGGRLAYHEIKALGGFKKEDKAALERAVTELQTGLFITICGRKARQSRTGESYGWGSAMYCTTEEYFGRMDEPSQEEAEARIAERVLLLNPSAAKKNIQKFIYG